MACQKLSRALMWRWLYRNLYFLDFPKDTVPRRKWLKLISSATAPSLLHHQSSGQISDPSGKQFVAVIIDEGASAPNLWRSSHQISPFNLVNVSTGNLFTQIPIVSFSGRGLPASFSLFHNSVSTSSLQPFGYGWTHSHNWKIQQDNQGNAIVVRGTGRKHLYTYDPETANLLVSRRFC